MDVHVLEDGPEYIGEAPNLARDLLYVDPEVGIMLHSSVVKRLSPEQFKDLKIVKLEAKGEIKEIEPEEIKELWVIPI